MLKQSCTSVLSEWAGQSSATPEGFVTSEEIRQFAVS
jgi:hypothetical protein